MTAYDADPNYASPFRAVVRRDPVMGAKVFTTEHARERLVLAVARRLTTGDAGFVEFWTEVLRLKGESE